MIVLGAKYHVGCLADCAGHLRATTLTMTSPKKITVIRKKEKRNCKSITIAEIITLKQNPRTRQPRTAVFMLSDSRIEGLAAAEKQDILYVCY